MAMHAAYVAAVNVLRAHRHQSSTAAASCQPQHLSSLSSCRTTRNNLGGLTNRTDRPAEKVPTLRTLPQKLCLACTVNYY
jgi:hypothetical protein